jgi:hypothetical protein
MRHRIIGSIEAPRGPLNPENGRANHRRKDPAVADLRLCDITMLRCYAVYGRDVEVQRRTARRSFQRTAVHDGPLRVYRHRR